MNLFPASGAPAGSYLDLRLLQEGMAVLPRQE